LKQIRPCRGSGLFVEPPVLMERAFLVECILSTIDKRRKV